MNETKKIYFWLLRNLDNRIVSLVPSKFYSLLALQLTIIYVKEAIVKILALEIHGKLKENILMLVCDNILNKKRKRLNNAKNTIEVPFYSYTMFS
jgi:hypothetical protein